MGGLLSHHVVPLQYKGVEGGGTRPKSGKVYGPATDLNRWSLEICEGRQTWRYLPSPSDPQPNYTASRYHLGQDTVQFLPTQPKPYMVEDALRNSLNFFSMLQTSDGHWAGDYGGPMFLLPGYAIATYITGVPVPEENKLEIVRYLSNQQSIEGGWGIHTESLPTVFGTSLNYCAMRIFGVSRDDPRMVKAREWLDIRGGCLGVPQWGKVWLSILGVFNWEGVNCLFPEMALLPRWFPFHSWRMWAYCRTVYMPMSYLYGIRLTSQITPLVRELREELLPEPYETIKWASVRNRVAKEDLYTPHPLVLRFAFCAFNIFEKICPRWLRRWALDETYTVGVEKEDQFTNYICIGPVNKMMNMLCVWSRKGKDSPEFRKHLERLPDYLWMGKDGMKMQGTNGSQLWDCAFMVQALVENRSMREEYGDVFQKAHDFLDLTQIKINHPDHHRYYRDETKGGWPFSTRDIGYLVADCTGEGLKGALICMNYSKAPIAEGRIFDAVNILINMQNPTGGYATIEKTRGTRRFEWFNASEVFGDIMIDYDYVECTSSALTGLSLFHKKYPAHRVSEVTNAIHKARDFMLSIQREDGSWEGMWGICFTYGTWFAVDGLIEAGLSPDHPAIKKACAFLVSKQKEDGGWGETFMSCVTRNYVQHPQSQVVNTAWATLTLLRANYPGRRVIDKGISLLLSRQLKNGDW
eukprot:Ihof_evm17s60 gene=Ihof_evmTU17s60